MSIAVQKLNAPDMSERVLPKSAAPEILAGVTTLTLLSRHQETADIVSFTFSAKRADKKPFHHHPGQALSVTISLADEEVVRTFTIASCMAEDDTITLTIKAGREAHATRFLHNELGIGDTLKARGPFGTFSLVLHPPAPMLLIGAGSGLTPMMSMLRWLAARREKVDVAFVQCVRTPNDLLFLDELEELGAVLPNLTCHVQVSRVPAGMVWYGPQGTISRAGLVQLVPDLGHRRVFCCGPTGFMATVKSIYCAEGGDAAFYHTESFGQEIVRDDNASVLDIDASNDGLVGRVGNHRFAIPVTKTIVEAAATAGLIIPTACRQGLCGTCKMRLLAGEVSMSDQGGLSAREAREGYILACCSHAKTDLVLERT